VGTGTNALVQSCYTILGLEETASREEVIAASIALRKHCEAAASGKDRDRDGTWERLKEITWARDTLLDLLPTEKAIDNPKEESAATAVVTETGVTDQPSRRYVSEPVAPERRSLRSFCALAVVVLFLLGLIYLYGAGHSQQTVKGTGSAAKESLFPGVSTGSEPTGKPGFTAGSANDTAQMLQEAKRAVVTLKFGNGLGSGFLVTPDGYIATNGHVLAAPRGIAQFSSGETADVEIVRFEPERDFALLRTGSSTNFPFLKLGDSNLCREGDTVFAIGSPRGLESTFTKGIVSAKDRKLPQLGLKLIQTDAAINQGNSGGPLINAAGEVIGINTLTVDKRLAEGLNFAIAINDVKMLIADGQRLSDTERARETAHLESRLAEQARTREVPREDIDQDEQRQYAEYQDRVEALKRRLEKTEKRQILVRCLLEVGKEAEDLWNEQCRATGLAPGCKLPMKTANPLNIRSVKAQTDCLDRNPQ